MALLLGRDREVGRVERALGGGQRLVTLWGPAGIGKTTLAVHVLERARARGEAGWFCDLSAARDAAGVVAAAARDLRVERAEMAAVASDLVAPGEHESALELALVLAERGPALVVLDNFEQVSAAAPQTLGLWISAAPAARFVVTSRERLRLSAELAFELEPLSLGPRGEGEPGEHDEGDSAAVALLIARVRAGRPGYEPDADERGRLRAIAAELQGIPLALELAAARVDMLGSAGVLARLRGAASGADATGATPQLDLLSRGRRDAPPRQATLRHALEWSWSLLAPAERAALAQLSVFRGDFSPAAAEALLEGLASSVDGGSDTALDVLQSLREKSLVRARSGDAGVALGLFESVRELASEKLEAGGEREAAEQRHGAYYLERARSLLGLAASPATSRSAVASASSPTQADGGDDALPSYELANLLAIVRRLLAGDTLPAARADDLNCCLLAIDRARGSSAGHLELLERGVDSSVAVEGASAALAARALRARGVARQLRARLAPALADLERARELARDAGDAELEASLLADIGVLHHQRRAVTRAAECYDAALSRYRALGDRRAEARVQANLAALHHDTRHFEEAARDYQRALVIFAEVGDLRLQGVHRTNLGILEQERGELAEAEACYERALAILRRLGDARYEAITLGNLGVLRHEQRRLADARDCHERALRKLAEVSDVKSEALCRCRLAMVLAEDQDAAGAAEHLRAGEVLLTSMGSAVEQVVGGLARGFLELCEARAAAREGDTAAARERLARVRDRIGRALAPSTGAELSALSGESTGGSNGGSDAGAAAGAARSPAELSDDVRSSVRLLERALGEAPELAVLGGAAGGASAGAPVAKADEAHAGSAAGSAAAASGDEARALSDDALVVGPDARWFRPPNGAWNDFRQRRAMRLILLHLVELHRRAPGRGADIDGLLAAGWPGERVRADAAANRVYVALAGLRKLGLKPYLLRQDDGYLLDPSLPLQWTSQQPASFDAS